MSKQRQIKSVIRDRRLTPEEVAKYRELREQIASDKPALLARGQAIRDNRQAQLDELRQTLLTSQADLDVIFQLLRAEREVQGLSLADIKDRCGMDRQAISRLENEGSPNATINTLQRYADALGKRILVALEDK
jgi:hypothetical protein